MEKLILTAEEAAKALGTRSDTVRTMLKNGEIPAYREGKNWKIPMKLLQQYVEKRALEETEERRYGGE